MLQIQTNEAVRTRQGEEPNWVNLEKYLKENLVDFQKIVEINQYPGGYSNLTYQVISQTREYVMRRAPLGANIKNAHDMSREYKVLSMLQKQYKAIPKVEMYCDDETIIGAPFYLMEKVEGLILRAKNITNYEFTAEKWKHLSETLVDNLANLHQINIYESDLVSLGKPEGYVDRQVEGWIIRYSKSKTDEISNMDSVALWLNKNKPRAQKHAFIHNDYKYDNVIFNNELTEVKAVLDWEMATVGDPLMDLGATLAYWCEKDEGDFLKTMNITWLEGNLNRKEVVNRYANITKIDTSDILFYYIFGLYKNAVIIQQIYARWKAGLTKDPRFERLIFGVKELANLAETAIILKSI
ncbi:MAG: phosphotransferase family protein [Bacteroidota bacterium]